jgi:hypothetical protein
MFAVMKLTHDKFHLIDIDNATMVQAQVEVVDVASGSPLPGMKVNVSVLIFSVSSMFISSVGH